MKKLLLGLSISGITMLTGVVSGYFESRYRCNIQSGSITISMDTGEQTCFGYLGSLHTLLNQVDTDINQANNYITWGTDVAYWTGILGSLTTQRDSLKNRQSQTLLAIEDFERSLFNQIKSLLQFYLKEQRTAIIQSVDNLRVQLVASKTVGNKLMFEQHLKSMESLQYKLFLLDRIQFAHDFEELVPFLKEFLYGGGKL